MDWLDSGGFSLYGDTPDYGTAFDFGNTYGSDFGGGFGSGLGADSFGGGFSPSYDTSWLDSYINPAPPPMAPQAPISQPSAQQPANSWLGAGLGALGPLAGLIGTLAGGGAGATTKPVVPTAAKAAINQSGQLLSPFAQGQTPLQMQQASLLNAIMSGQGLAQPYGAAIEQAFEPQLGSLYEQAANAGRRRGFYDAPATSPVGGAILGPGLANLQGQIAAAKIAQMNALPGLFQQPINSQILAAGNQGDTMLRGAGLQVGSQQSQPFGAQLGQSAAGVLGGAAAGYNATQQANQQQQYQNSLLSALRYPGYGA